MCYPVELVSEPRFFRDAAAFRRWLEKNHAKTDELLVGFYHVGSGKGGITYPEALDQALCFGWIDGVRRRHETGSYTVRFSPRIKGSIWSVINTRRMEQLISAGHVHPSGLGVFESRDKKKSKLYSYELRAGKFQSDQERQFRANTVAWEFYQQQAPWYRRVTCHWVISAKKEETRLRRLMTLIHDSAHARRIKQLISNPKKPA